MIDTDRDEVAGTQAETERFAALLRSVPLDLPVPHCPGWAVEDVGRHLAGDYLWATRIITTRTAPRSGLRAVRQRGPALLDRFDRAARDMVEALALAAADPDGACPNFADGDAGRLGWWPRHQLHETTLHRWDVERAAGVAGALDPDRSADGVDELLHVYTCRYRPHRLTRPLTLRCTDVAASWRVVPVGASGGVAVARIEGRGVRAADAGTSDVAASDVAEPDVVRMDVSEPDAEVSGPASDLLLLLWRRLDLHETAVRTSDDAAVRELLAGPVVA